MRSERAGPLPTDRLLRGTGRFPQIGRPGEVVPLWRMRNLPRDRFLRPTRGRRSGCGDLRRPWKHCPGARSRDRCFAGRFFFHAPFPVLRPHQEDIHDAPKGDGSGTHPRQEKRGNRQEMGGRRQENRKADPRRLLSRRVCVPASHGVLSSPPSVFLQIRTSAPRRTWNPGDGNPFRSSYSLARRFPTFPIRSTSRNCATGIPTR